MFLCFGTGCPAASFDDLWKQVEKYERQDLPKSAYKVVGQIAAKADKERQKGQQMAALLYGCKLRQDIVPDSFYSDIMKLERLKRQTADEVQRAVLASVLGELYEDNANRNRNYSDRTDAHPDSIREWSWEQFMKVSSENYLLSMARPDLLAAAKAADYMPFVEKGKDAGYFGGDLLNVIGRRAVQARANKGEGSYVLDTVYARMLAVYRAQGNREAELLVSVDSVAFALERGDVELAGQTGGLSPEETERVVLQSPAYKAYERLLSCFGDLPLSAEVYLGMLDLEVTPGTKVAWAEEGYAKYKAYPRAKELLNRKRQLEAPFVFLRFPAEVYPGVPNGYVVEHRNVAGMSLSWYQLPDGFPKAYARRAEYRKDEAAYARKYGVLRKTDRLNWQSQPAFLQVEDTFRLACPGVLLCGGREGRRCGFIRRQDGGFFPCFTFRGGGRGLAGQHEPLHGSRCANWCSRAVRHRGVVCRKGRGLLHADGCRGKGQMELRGLQEKTCRPLQPFHKSEERRRPL